MTYAERRALQEGPQPPKQAPRTTPLPGRQPMGMTVQCPKCYSTPGEPCAQMHPNGISRLGLLGGSHIARIEKEANQS
jgi:hypothetical protein